MATIEDALVALQKHFGFADFREGQREVIDAILEGHDTVVVMPTGGGKSLCFQLPALMKEGATLVVSPLIALMKDQVDALHARGLPATFINSSVDFEEQKARVAGVRQGRYKLIYVAPERFRSAHFVEALRSANISLVAIDEAHCISQWGHDFRPDYLRLQSFVEQIGRPQTVALTATATPYVRADIIQQLHLRDPRAFVSGFDRPNLSLNIVHTQNEREKIKHIKSLAARYEGGSGIIYTSTRKSVEQVTSRLLEAGLSVVAYHAGMEDNERVRAQDDFMSGRKQMIVATNAFGMGIDKSDIRFVAHYHLTGSIEAYYQEIGRAGRDGLPATCVLLFNYADKRTQDYFIEGSYPPPEVIAKVYEALVGTGQQRIELSTREIAARAGLRNEMAVQSSLITLEKAGHIERGAAGENRATVRLLLSPQEATERISARRGGQLKQVLSGLLEVEALSGRAETELDVSDLAERLGVELQAMRRSLSSLAEAGVISYQPARRTRGVLMLDETPVKQLRIRPQEIARRAALEQRKLREMISFCYVETCFRAFILDYFGDRSHAATCGMCANCLKEKKATKTTTSDAFVETADEDLYFTNVLEETTVGFTEEMTRGARRAPLDPPNAVDHFRMRHTPVALDLEDELRAQSHLRRVLEESDASIAGSAETVEITEARTLNEAEALRVRKILACAARMQGRFGKGLLASTLRGSRAKNVSQAGLERLSTYGILSDMTQEEILLYIDALVSAGCLAVAPGTYPTVALTSFGGEVMREREQVKLALPVELYLATAHPRASGVSAATHSPSAPRTTTRDETYVLYQAGLSIEEICSQRGLTEITVEKHLADCIVEGRELDVSQHVSQEDRALIELTADLVGTEHLKPLREALPRHITYRMIRFVLADMQRAARNVAG
ncbi:MAG TPA: RecQ family ATP-dependent DNA helicase [Pyrinomonadaceae bacterium]|jgi:ATP-dependent DNA helicase RecQ|nr:RecQ family ATP-dependent DNA helicase [Pyrinomonadaceae bacterium]